MAQIGSGEVAAASSQCLSVSGSYQQQQPQGDQPGGQTSSGGGQQQGQASPAGSSSQYESQHSPFGDLQGAVQGVQEFHAEFITHPISYNPVSGGRGSPPRMTGSPEQSPSPSSVSPNNTLPSFIDTYTPSVVTIEPRPFGAEAEYENRLRHKNHPHHPQQQHPQPHQMTVKFHLKTEAPDTFAAPGPGPGRGPPGGHHGHPSHPPAPVFASMSVNNPQSYDTYQPPATSSHTSEAPNDIWHLKKEPPHSYSSATPGSSPSPSPATSLQPEFVDFFHPPSSQGQLTTLTNYIPFSSEYHHGHGHGPVSDNNCPKFEADIESLNRVRRTILATPQPM